MGESNNQPQLDLTDVWQDISRLLSETTSMKQAFAAASMNAHIEEAERRVVTEAIALEDCSRVQLGVLGLSTSEQAALINALLASDVVEGLEPDPTVSQEDVIYFCATDPSIITKKKSPPSPVATDNQAVDTSQATSPPTVVSQSTLMDQARVLEQNKDLFAQFDRQIHDLLPSAFKWNVVTYISYASTCSVYIRYKSIEEVNAALSYLKQTIAILQRAREINLVESESDTSPPPPSKRARLDFSQEVNRISSKPPKTDQRSLSTWKDMDLAKIHIALAACGLDPNDVDLFTVDPTILVASPRFSSLFQTGHVAIRRCTFPPIANQSALSIFDQIRHFLAKHAVGWWSAWHLIDAIKIEVPVRLLQSGLELVHFGGSIDDDDRSVVNFETNQVLMQDMDAILLIWDERNKSISNTRRLQWLDTQGFFDAMFWSTNAMLLFVKISGENIIQVQSGHVAQFKPYLSLSEKFQKMTENLITRGIFNGEAIFQNDVIKCIRSVIKSLHLQLSKSRAKAALENIVSDVIKPMLKLHSDMIYVSSDLFDRGTAFKAHERSLILHHASFRLAVIDAVGQFYDVKARKVFLEEIMSPFLKRRFQQDLELFSKHLRDPNSEESQLLKNLLCDSGMQPAPDYAVQLLLPLFTNESLMLTWLMHQQVSFVTSPQVGAPSQSEECKDLVEYVMSLIEYTFLHNIMDEEQISFRKNCIANIRYHLRKTTTNSIARLFKPLRGIVRSNCARLARPYLVDITNWLLSTHQQFEGNHNDFLDLLDKQINFAIKNYALDLCNYTIHAIDHVFEGVLKLSFGYAAEEAVYRYAIAWSLVAGECPFVCNENSDIAAIERAFERHLAELA